MINNKRFKSAELIRLLSIVISVSILIIGISGCSQQVISSNGEKASLPGEQAVPSDKVSNAQAGDTPLVSSDKVSSEQAGDTPSIPEQKEDVAGDHTVFKVTELTEKDFQSVEITAQARKKLPFDGHFEKKMAIIDGNLIIVDDFTSNEIYQFDPDTLKQEKAMDIPSDCTVGLSDKYILIIKASKVEYYNGNLELKKTVKIKADSSFRKEEPVYWGIVVIDENHIAWHAHDRSVSAMEVDDGDEKNIKRVDDNLSVLTEDIYKTGSPNQILISGTAYKDEKDISVSHDDIIAIADITQGIVTDFIHKTELEHACISTRSRLVYRLPPEVTARSHFAIDGFFPEFDKLYDLDNRKVYHFIDEQSINANNFIASYYNYTNFYFIMFSLEDGKEINYLIKV